VVRVATPTRPLAFRLRLADEQIAYNLVMAQLMRTSNPALKGDFLRTQAGAFGADAMTVSGTVNKTGILSICVIATAAWTWSRFLNSPSPETVLPAIMIGAIGGFVLALVTIFKKEWSPVTAPAYALLEGLVLGGVSAMFELRFPGIAMQAVGLTFGTLIALLLAYRSGLIRVTDQFRLGVVAATGGIALFYLITFVLGFFGVHFNSVYGSGPIGIGFSVVVVIVAALNLVLDFDLIESGARSGAPKYMEWYGAFALMVTLIWLYLEIIRLLSKLRSRN
jgi:uncharacterized YccA/Bax inhibitor family protein